MGSGSTEAESKDRATLGLPDVQQQLLEAVQSAVSESSSAKLVVVVISAGPVYLYPGSADAVLYAGYPGMEAGHGITDIIFGRVSPSARFPITVYDSEYLSLVGPVSDFSMTSNGVGRTYRYLDERKSKPLYKFGFGLSYSTFRYSELHLATYDKPNVVASCLVTNTGDSNAHEVAQLYVSVPGAGARAPLPIPYRSLQGFRRLYLKAGESLPVSFVLTPNQIATTMANGTRVVTRGNYTVAMSGHQPDDAAGLNCSNVVVGSFVI